MRFDATGTRLFCYLGRLCLPHRGHVLSFKRRVMFRITSPSVWWTVQYAPSKGYWCLRINQAGDPNGIPTYACHRREFVAIKRRSGMGEANLPSLPLPATSLILAKLPLVREFITATTYDDQTLRAPGYFTMRNKSTQFEVTFYDPDPALRLPCRGLTIDDAFALAEKLLGTDGAPWEHDQYLSECAARKKKRKK